MNEEEEKRTEYLGLPGPSLLSLIVVYDAEHKAQADWGLKVILTDK